MANFVMKKDGTREPFDAEKVKRGVVAAASQAGLSEEETAKVADQVSSTIMGAFMGVEEVSTAEVKEKILSELDSSAPSVAEAWRSYEATK